MGIQEKIKKLPERNHDEDKRHYVEVVFELARTYRDDKIDYDGFVAAVEQLQAKNPDSRDPLLQSVEWLLDEALLDKEYFLNHLDTDLELALTRIDSGYRSAVLPVVYAQYVRRVNGATVSGMTVLVGNDGVRSFVYSDNQLSDMLVDELDVGKLTLADVQKQLPKQLGDFVIVEAEFRRWVVAPERAATRR